ncbi:MAG: AglZ/HisF2 family acetamidino modification protein [Bacteroidetes bacterium]|nr:AglZ/HisF2 family acetamidino modification protein [Bacteroidota bacterium]
MFRPRVIPVLLLKNKGLVKTVKFGKSRYIGDPINAVRIFNDLQADELVFLDITATNENRTVSPELVRNIGDEAFMPFAVGGGIRSLSDAKELLSSGAEKIVLNTAAVRNPGLIKEIAETYGNQSVIVCIDVKKRSFGKYKVYINSGKKRVTVSPVEHAKNMASLGAGEIMINSVSNDGMMTGYDLDLIKTIAGAVGIPVIACGGARNTEDLVKAVNIGGAGAAAAGSLFVYHGPRRGVLVNYPERKTLEAIFN